MTARHLLLPILFAASTLQAQQPLRDAPPPDIGQILQALKAFRDRQAVQKKSLRETALRQVQPLASSPSAATGAWEDAVRHVQFDGSPKESAAFREWKEGPGGALSDKGCQAAVQLYFRWLALTLQRANGAATRELLPAVVAYARDLQVNLDEINDLEEAIKREAELAKTGKHGVRDRRRDDQKTTQLHIEILGALAGSPPVKALGLESLIDAEAWEMAPGNLDGIYQTIILPELRSLRDPRVLDYWDLKIKRAGERVQKTRLAFDLDKFNTETKPGLLWSKAREYANLGLKNRALTEMFNVLKTYPSHPNASGWIAEIEALLAPPAPASAEAPAPAGTPPDPASPR